MWGQSLDAGRDTGQPRALVGCCSSFCTPGPGLGLVHRHPGQEGGVNLTQSLPGLLLGAGGVSLSGLGCLLFLSFFPFLHVML